MVADHAHRHRKRRSRMGLRSTRAVGTHHQRQIGARGRIARDEVGGVLVGGGIEQMMRLAVARQKILQPRHVAERGRADQHRAADAALDQVDPAQDQRAHDALAEIGFGDQERAQFLRRNQQRLDLALGMAVDQRDAAGELADLGQELPRPLIDDRRDMAEAVALGDRDMARQHHEHARPRLAGFEQHFAVLVDAHLAEPAHAVDFVRRQRRKGLLRARKRKGGRVEWIDRGVVCGHVDTRIPQNESRTGYRPGPFPLASSSAASASSEGAEPASLRPLACDFRRLRFSRSASLSRSSRESFATALSCPSRLP